MNSEDKSKESLIDRSLRYSEDLPPIEKKRKRLRIFTPKNNDQLKRHIDQQLRTVYNSTPRQGRAVDDMRNAAVEHIMKTYHKHEKMTVKSDFLGALAEHLQKTQMHTQITKESLLKFAYEWS